MNALDGDLLSEIFGARVEGLREDETAIVAIDGKTSRRSHSGDRRLLHVVSAWAARQRLVLGQQATDAKSNEITAILLLLARLQHAGALVTIDAMGAQTKTGRSWGAAPTISWCRHILRLAVPEPGDGCG
jgi:hypothetical protein